MRVAVLSVHTCPLETPGTREAGGMNVYVIRTAEEMAARGIAVDIFTRWYEPDAPHIVEVGPNLRVIHLEAGGQVPRPKEDIPPHLPEFFRRLVEFQRSEGLQYDLVHSHYWLSGWVGSRLQRLWRVPHVVMFHTLGAVKNQARVGEHESALRVETEGQVVRRAGAIVVASPEEHTRLLRHHPAAQGKAHIIPCGVDLDLFRPLDQAVARQQLGLNGERILLFVGRPDPLKGLEILLSAADLLEDPDGIRVLVIGGEPDVAQPPPVGFGRGGDADVAQPPPAVFGRGAFPEALEGPRQGGVSFLGRVSHQMLPYYYNAADVCVIPSYYESFGMVALEAMACGLPVVAARVGGLQSTVRDGETGYLIPWHCPEPFAERLEIILGNDTLRSRLGEASRVAAESYRWSSVADRLLELYEEVTE